MVTLDAFQLGAGGFGAWSDISQKMPEATPSWSVAALVYLLLVLGLSLFVILPADERTSGTLLRGAVLGLVVFGVFDGTNYCLFGPKVYPADLALKDVAWGAFLCAVSAAAGAHFLKEK